MAGLCVETHITMLPGPFLIWANWPIRTFTPLSRLCIPLEYGKEIDKLNKSYLMGMLSCYGKGQLVSTKSPVKH